MRALIGAAAAAFLLAATPAAAVVMKATYTGKVQGTFDVGAWGVTERDMYGPASFVAVFTYDTELGTIDTSFPGLTELYDGQAVPIVTIFGETRDAVGTTYSFDWMYHDYGILPSVYRQRAGLRFDMVGGGAIPAALDVPFTLTRAAGGDGQGRYLADIGVTDLTFTVDTMVVTRAVAVPEPATWAMLILGFGAAGAALRSRRRLSA